MRLCAPKLFLTLVVLMLSPAVYGVIIKEQTGTTNKRPFYLDGSRVIGYRNMPDSAHQLGMDFKVGPMIKDLGSSSAAVGLLYQHTRYYSDLTALNLGAHLTFKAYYGAFIDHQWMVRIGQAYEPFVRVGGGTLFSPTDEFAGFIKKERYHLRLTAGFEDLFQMDRHLRSEILLAVATNGLSFGVSFAYAFEDWSELWF